MQIEHLYPLLLKPPIKDYLWGGTKLKTDFGYKTEKDIAAEAQVLSCHKDGTNTVINYGDVCVKLTEVFDLNLKGVLMPCQVFMPDMIGKGGCSVLNISSMNAYRPLTKIPAYSATKAAVSNFTSWLAVHFAKENIRVNAIAPGFFVTNQNRGLLFNEDGTATPRTDKILRSTPMGRFGEAEELLGTVEWLLYETKSGFVTGITVPVDGGFSAYQGVQFYFIITTNGVCVYEFR